jgi:hypothetical protein
MIAYSVPLFRIAGLHLLVYHKCHCTVDNPVHQLRGQLPAIALAEIRGRLPSIINIR